SRGREVLDVGGFVVGTLWYISPEQIRGQFVDARADLYALGCVLYECVTGQPPFALADAHAAFDAHLYQLPWPPSQLVDGVPPALDTLVLRLLQKTPEDRIGHADDVAAALAELGADGWDEAEAPRPQPYLYRPGFSGRADAVAELGRAVDGARARHGACV